VAQEDPQGTEDQTVHAAPQRTGVVPLTVLRHTEGAACHFVPPSGLYIGVLCYGDTTLTFSPVVVPAARLKSVALAVEITSCDREDESPTCSVKVVYLGRDGASRALVTPPLVADGDVVRVSIPVKHVRAGTVLATALQIALMDDVSPDVTLDVPDGIVSSGRRPILVRGAWLEILTEEVKAEVLPA
jgi:hypothetical protein